MQRVFWAGLGFMTIVASTAACGSAQDEAAPSPHHGASSSAGQGGSGGATTTSSSAATGGGTGGTSSLPHCEATDPRAVPVSLWAEPDAGEKPFVDSLNKATKSIRVMVYMMGYGGILDALKAKAGQGVSVRVILDQSEASVNQKYFDQLTAAGAEVHWSDPKFTYMHAKAFVVDDAEAVISTGNYLVTQMMKERNFVMRDDDADDVASVAAVFDADWQKSSPDLSCTRLLVSPVNSRDRILALIGSATKTLDIESMQFADYDVRNAVAARKAAGVTVRVLLADPSWISANTDAATFLAQHGIEARRMSFPNVHVKAITVDGARAYAGSENLSYTSLSKNREVGLVVTEPDAVATMHTTFETDWAKATAF